MPDLAINISSVLQRITSAAEGCGRAPYAVHLLAVSKTRPASDIEAAWRAGQRRFGENYLQEALDKITQLRELDLEWHFIGPIQSNKTRAIAEHFHWVHSVDRLKVAERLAAQRPPHLPPLQICLQVNIDAEDTKAGVSAEDVPALAAAVTHWPQLTLRGLMCIPRADTDPSASFDHLRQLLAALQARHPELPQLDTLSMGMSADLEAAVVAGATLVRVGSDIFGPRN